MKKIYLDDSYQQICQTQITSQNYDGNDYYVTLAETIIYPGGGGQPADLAWINDEKVLAIRESKEPEEVRYYLENPLPDTAVTVKIDWQRRFDFMQQHTGQHLFARACENLFAADIRQEQITENDSFFEISGQQLTEKELQRAIDQSNQIIQAHRQVKILYPAADQLTSLPNLTHPPTYFSGLRLIAVDGFDTIGCGGTHVRNTSEIQIILLDKIKHTKKGTTVHFSCGHRAAKNYQTQQELIQEAVSSANISVEELPQFISAQQQEIKGLKDRLAVFQLQELVDNGNQLTPHFVVSHGDKIDGKLLRQAAQQLAEKTPNALIAVFTEEDEILRYHLRIASADKLSVRELIQTINRQLSGKGGGSPVMGDGTVPLDHKEEFLTLAETASEKLR